MIADARAALGLGDAAFAQSEFNVLLDRQPGKQRIFLEHDAAVGARLEDRLAIKADIAAGCPVEAGNNVEQRRFPATARTQDREKLIVADFKIDAVECNELLLPRNIDEVLSHPADGNARLLLPECGRRDDLVHRPRLQRSTQRPINRMIRSLKKPSAPTLSIAAMMMSSLRK